MDIQKVNVFPVADLSGADVVFGTRDSVLKIMPRMSDIPESFRERRTIWDKLVSEWFFCGLSNLELTRVEGVDEKKALGHIRCIL